MMMVMNMNMKPRNQNPKMEPYLEQIKNPEIDEVEDET